MRQESFKMERPGLVKPGDKIQITEYQSYMNYSYIIEPAVAMSGCYPNSQRIKAKEGTIVSVEKGHLMRLLIRSKRRSTRRIWRLLEKNFMEKTVPIRR